MGTVPILLLQTFAQKKKKLAFVWDSVTLLRYKHFAVCPEFAPRSPLESAWREVDGIPIPQSEPDQLQIMKEIHERP
jgi:hypothetical protein